MKRDRHIFFAALAVCLISCSDGSGPFDLELPAESFSLQITSATINKTYSDALLAVTDVDRHALKNFPLQPNYTHLQSMGTALVLFYSKGLGAAKPADCRFGMKVSYPQKGTYSLTELFLSNTDSIDLRIDSLVLIPLSGTLKIVSSTASDPSAVGSTGWINGDINGSFINAADSSQVYTIKGSFLVN